MRTLILIISTSLLSMCNSGNQMITQETNSLAPLVIYKTTKDYTNHIPILMDKSKERIISYPAISDIYFNGTFAKPDKLAKNFMLDNFGLSPNSVYTSYTFSEYANLKEVPSIDEFMERIIDANPITEMYVCGKRTEFEQFDEINKLIKKELNRCEKLK